MKFQKFISLILHPMVIPTIGVLVYFLLIPNSIHSNQRNYVLGLIFATTYLVPLLVLILLKTFRLIKSFQVHSVKERKIPVFLMIFLYYVLGNRLIQFNALQDFGILFYATAFGLIAVYLFFIFRLKVSLHLLSMGIMSAFFITVSIKYSISLLSVIMICFLLSGLLASSRLHLKAHTPKEVYIGFFFGIFSQVTTFYFLQ